MSVTIPDDILMATRMTERELKQEIAVMLFAQEKISLGEASRFAEMKEINFQYLLASREIPIHEHLPDLQKNLEEIKAAMKVAEPGTRYGIES